MFVSSHLMSEMALTAQHLIVIGRGRLIADTGMEEFIAGAAPSLVRVRSTDPAALATLLRSRDVAVSGADDGALAVSGLSRHVPAGRPFPGENRAGCPLTPEACDRWRS